jgi:hypothetical protein
LYNCPVFRFLSEYSETSFYKAGTKSKDEDAWKRAPEGKFISSTDLVIDTSSLIMEVLCKIIEVKIVV